MSSRFDRANNILATRNRDHIRDDVTNVRCQGRFSPAEFTSFRQKSGLRSRPLVASVSRVMCFPQSGEFPIRTKPV